MVRVCCVEREDARNSGEEDSIYGEATELGFFGVRGKGRCDVCDLHLGRKRR